MPTASSGHEKVVRRSTPMHKDYVFVPKGNVYITGNCRKQTRTGGQIVYAVVDKNKRAVGIRVPSSVYQAVLATEASTRADRASAVQKRDHALEREFREAVKKWFPDAPAKEVPTVVMRAMEKGSGRVGRTSKMGVEEKAKLAVRAHIRHVHTDYDKLLRTGLSREEARKNTMDQITSVAKSWGHKTAHKDEIKRQTKGNIKKTRARVKKREKRSTKAERPVQGRRSDQNMRSRPSPPRAPPSPKERRLMKLASRHQRNLATDSSSPGAARSKIGQSLLDDGGSEIEESDEYMDSSDSLEWSESESDADSDLD